MKNTDSSLPPDTGFSRRKFLAGAAGFLPLVMTGKAMGADTLPPPKYTLAVHMNANFIRQAKSMPVDERFTLAASLGAKAYQIGAFSNLDLDEYRRNADKHGMRCASLAGTGRVGLSTGLTAPGHEKTYLDFFTKAVEAAKVLGAQNMVSFVGERVDTVPWETQYKANYIRFEKSRGYRRGSERLPDLGAAQSILETEDNRPVCPRGAFRSCAR